MQLLGDAPTFAVTFGISKTRSKKFNKINIKITNGALMDAIGRYLTAMNYFNI